MYHRRRTVWIFAPKIIVTKGLKTCIYSHFGKKINNAEAVMDVAGSNHTSSECANHPERVDKFTQYTDY